MSERNIMIIIGKKTFRQKTLVLSCKKKTHVFTFQKEITLLWHYEITMTMTVYKNKIAVDKN